HAGSHPRETDGLHTDAPEPWYRPDSNKEAEEQEQIDCAAPLRGNQVVSDRATSLVRNINGAQDNWGEEADTVGGDIHQEPRRCDKYGTTSVRAREKNRDRWRLCRHDRTCWALASGIDGKLQHCLTLPGHDSDKGVCCLGESASSYQPMRALRFREA